MRIGIDASRANVAGPRTGTEWYSFFIIRELITKDTKNTYVLYVKESLREDMKDWANYAEVRVLSWPPKFLWNLLRLSVEMLLHPPDLLFVPAHTIPLLRPKKTVTTCHDIGFDRFPELYANTPIGPKTGMLKILFSIAVSIFTLGRYQNNELNYHRFSMRLAVQKATRIITVSEFSKSELLAQYHADPKKMRVIYHGVNMAYHPYETQDREPVLKKFGVHSPYLFFIGRWEEKKNIAYLFRSFAELRRRGYPQSLVMVGKPGWGFEKAWAEIPNDVRQHILLLTSVTSEAPQLMAGADVFVFPSAYEGFGMPVLEAMQAGVPVVCSNLASLPEAAGGAALCVDPTNTTALADAIGEVLSSPATRDDLKKKGFTRAGEFSWERAGKETLQAITEW